MTLEWYVPSRTQIGTDGLAGWLRERAVPSVVVMVDPRLRRSVTTDRVRAAVTASGARVREVPTEPTDLTGVLDRAALIGRDVPRDTAILGIGGGAAMDQAKLTALALSSPDMPARLGVVQRSGLVLVEDEGARRLPLVAVPTTLGTGAEVSASACALEPTGKRLVVGEALRPDLAVLDPAATATLPTALLVEGVLEILVRLVSMYVADHREMPVEDALALGLARETRELGDRLVRPRPGDDAEQLRVELAKIAGLSHAGWMTLGRNRYSFRGWYVANEVSTVLGLRKMTAVAAILPTLWRTVTDGDPRHGSAPRLHRLWRALCADRDRPLPDDPATGIAALIDDWRIGRTVHATDDEVTTISARCMRRWGAGLPMLAGLRAADVRRLVERSVVAPAGTTPVPDAVTAS